MVDEFIKPEDIEGILSVDTPKIYKNKSWKPTAITLSFLLLVMLMIYIYTKMVEKKLFNIND